MFFVLAYFFGLVAYAHIFSESVVCLAVDCNSNSGSDNTSIRVYFEWRGFFVGVAWLVWSFFFKSSIFHPRRLYFERWLTKEHFPFFLFFWRKKASVIFGATCGPF